jgi:hypothetical protein
MRFPSIRKIFAVLAAPMVAMASLPTILLQPASVQVHAGDTATFTVYAQGADSVRWYVNGSEVSRGAASANLVLPAVQLSQDGSKISCVLTNASQMISCDQASLSVLKPSREMLTFTGELSDRFGNPLGGVSGQSVDMVIEVFRTVQGGTPDFSEVFLTAEGRGVPVQNGKFVARLGTGRILTGNISTLAQQQNTLYGQFSIGTPDTREILTPRVPLTAAPFALSSAAGQIKAAGSPIVLGVEAPIGTRYIDTNTGNVWLRSFRAWVQLP